MIHTHSHDEMESLDVAAGNQNMARLPLPFMLLSYHETITFHIPSSVSQRIR